jgi:cell division protein FtsB
MRSRHKKSSPFSLFAFQDIITSVTGIMILITMTLALDLVQKATSSPRSATPAIAEQVEVAVKESEQEISRLEQILGAGVGSIHIDAETARKQLKDLERARKELDQQNASLSSEVNAASARKQAVDEQAQSVSPEALQQLQAEVVASRDQIRKLKESNRVVFNRPAGTSKTSWLVQLDKDSVLVAESGKNAAPLEFSTPEEFLGWAGGQDADSMYFVVLIKPSGIERFGPIRETLQSDGFDLGYDLLSADQTAIDPETGAGTP